MTAIRAHDDAPVTLRERYAAGALRERYAAGALRERYAAGALR
jgi:uncharacterized membrane protein